MTDRTRIWYNGAVNEWFREGGNMRNHIQLADAYYRLSDEERKYGESASITNQRTIVREYCEKHGIILVEEFVDDGFSGGNFERPGFQAMLEHLKTGKANMVITKDLSRLGRDMTESSHYAERYFPEHGIRYLAPGSNFDSEEDNLMAPFQFAMNDVYLRDTSRKVKQTLNTKRNNGKYVACPPYGYRKAERTTDQLVPDVKMIFDLAASGQSCRSIAIRLNESCVMPPLKYRVECRDNFTERGARRASDEWNYTTVKRILRNRVYLGHTLLGKSRKVSVKSKKKILVPEDEWVFTKDTHQALVSQEQFDLAAHFMGENTKANGANPAFRHSIFGGIAYCACCGAAMCSGGSVYNGEREKYWYLVCNNLTSRAQHRCAHGARIRYDDLMEVVRRDLNKLLSFDDDGIRAITESAIEQANASLGGADPATQIENIDKQTLRLKKMIERSYRDNIAGMLGDDIHGEMVKKFGVEIEELAARRKKLVEGETTAKEIRSAYGLFFDLAKKYTCVEKLDRDMLHAFIERIEIGEKILPEGRKVAGPRTPYRQSIRIFYRFIGEVSGDNLREMQANRDREEAAYAAGM